MIAHFEDIIGVKFRDNFMIVWRILDLQKVSSSSNLLRAFVGLYSGGIAPNQVIARSEFKVHREIYKE